MKNVSMMCGCLVGVLLLWGPLISDAAPGCDAKDEEQWVQLRDKLPTSDGMSVRTIIYDLTKLKDKCDPKTRFSASVVRSLIHANFREDELRRAQKHVGNYNALSRRQLQR